MIFIHRFIEPILVIILFVCFFIYVLINYNNSNGCGFTCEEPIIPTTTQAILKIHCGKKEKYFFAFTNNLENLISISN